MHQDWFLVFFFLSFVLLNWLHSCAQASSGPKWNKKWEDAEQSYHEYTGERWSVLLHSREQELYLVSQAFIPAPIFIENICRKNKDLKLDS